MTVHGESAVNSARYEIAETHISVRFWLLALWQNNRERVCGTARRPGLHRLLDLADNLIHVLREEIIQHPARLYP